MGKFDQLGVRLFEDIFKMLDDDPYLDCLEELMDPISMPEHETDDTEYELDQYDHAMDLAQQRLILRVSKALKNWATGKGVDDSIVRQAWANRIVAPSSRS